MANIGDLVRVAMQPENQIARIVNEVGFIAEIDDSKKFGNETWVQINTLKTDGAIGGVGWVPLRCLVDERSAHWIRVKRVYDEMEARRQAEQKAFQEHVNAGIEKVASEHGISAGEVRVIYDKVSRLFP